MRRLPALVLLGLLLFGLTAAHAPAFGQGSSATVSATLRVASTCLAVDPAAVDFGTLSLTQPASAAARAANPPATAAVTVRNCSAQPAAVLVRGGTAAGPGVAWSHAPGADVCAAPNLFIQGVRDLSRNERRLTTADQPLKTLAGGAGEPVILTLVPPCSGSSGAGATITVPYTFTAAPAESASR